MCFRTRAGALEAVSDLNLTVGAGEVYGVVGESGCGKTASFLACVGFLPPNGFVRAGTVDFDGRDLLAVGEAELDVLRGQELTYIPQDPRRGRFPAVGFDRDLGHRRLALALKVLLEEARLVAPNEDGALPSEEGLLPAAGAVVGAVRGMIKREPEAVIGKPNHQSVERALRRMGISESECAVVGDSIASDVALAKKMNMPSVLVLTGNTTREEVMDASLRPGYILDSTAGLTGLLGRGKAA